MNDNERERLIQKIMSESNYVYDTASNVLNQLEKVHPALNEVVDSWKNSIELPFEFNGISMNDIIKKLRGKYFDAIFTMSWLLENPCEIEGFLSMDFAIDDKWD